MLKEDNHIVPTIKDKEFKKTPRWKRFLSMPIIFSLLIPLVILDLWTEIYHHICFRLYGIKLIKRKEYIGIDRGKLEGLSFSGKIGCTYCGYANGLAAYLVAIAAETEAYWCAIVHQNKKIVAHQPHQNKFLKRNKFD